MDLMYLQNYVCHSTNRLTTGELIVHLLKYSIFKEKNKNYLQIASLFCGSAIHGLNIAEIVEKNHLAVAKLLRVADKSENWSKRYCYV